MISQVGDDALITVASVGSIRLKNFNYEDWEEENYVERTDASGNSFNFAGSTTILTSATYNASSAALEVTGADLVANSGTDNDIDVSKLTITGEGSNTYTLTSGDVELTSATTFSITLNATDELQLADLLNNNGTSSSDGTTYNIAAALNWNPGASSSPADSTGNAITVSNIPAPTPSPAPAPSPSPSPTLTSVTYDASSGALAVTGADLVTNSGSDNDIDVSKLTISGGGGNTYTLTSDDIELTSKTEFSLTLNAADQLQLAGLLNKNGTSSGGGTTYNIAAALNWNPGASSSPADSTGNAITVSNVTAPSLSSASYDDSTGVLVLSGSNLPAYPGASNDVDVSKLTITGGSGSTYTLTSDDVELTSATAASITLNSTDQTNLDSLLNKNGTASTQGTTYNIAAAEDWAPGADISTDIADLTGNAITVSNIPAPKPSPAPSPSPSPTPSPTRSQEDNAIKIQSINDITAQNKPSTFQLNKSVKVGDKDIKTIIIGTQKRDNITGTSFGEIITGMSGKDKYKGGGGADGFLSQNHNFSEKERDTIVDFNPDEGDSLLIDKNVFDFGKRLKLKIVKNKKSIKKAKNSEADFIYEKKRGLLFFNENGKQDGWGDGGLFVKLEGAPELGDSDFTIV